jgi:ribose transport system substrate-binding protein
MSELTQNSQKQPDKRRLHHKPYRLTLAIAFLLLVLLAVTAVCIILFETRIRGLTAAAPEPGTYTHHYAFIGDKTNSFDEKVFEAAQEEGKSTGNYVEFLGSTLDVSYSKIDLMKIAIAARVDGIIVSADDTEEMTEQIYNADQAGIPVVCVGADCIGSARKAYVGISYYTLGQTYGALLEKNASASDTASVLVLMSPNEQSKSQNIIYSGIRDYLDSAGLLQRLDLKTHGRRQRHHVLRGRIHHGSFCRRLPAGHPRLPRRDRHDGRLPGHRGL